MGKQSSRLSIPELETILTSVTEELSQVTSKKMFGCFALWADGNVFALVWKHGRVAVKLPDESTYQSLMDKVGAEPWRAGPMQMAHWVLVPESFHSKQSELRKWTLRAHDLCLKLKKKPASKVRSKVAAKKPLKRKAT